MKFAAASIETAGQPAEELRIMARQCRAQLGDPPDLAVVFFTTHFEDDGEIIRQAIRESAPHARIIGCSAESVIGPAAEHERTPAIALTFARMPGVKIAPFHMTREELADNDNAANIAQLTNADPVDEPAFMLLADPFTTPIDAVLNSFNNTYPERPVLGGMVSGIERPNQSTLLLDDEVHRQGAVGLAIHGPIDIEPVVSQGCRPIGQHYIITRSQQNIVLELGGKPALQRLQETIQTLEPDERQMASQALFVGRVINEYRDRFNLGDFLIRNLMAYDPKSGAIAIGDRVRTGATIQFHVRDQATADEDLRQRLLAGRQRGPARGALVFSCNGRGTRMWPAPNHDISVLQEVCGPLPAIGYFAAGELGPIGGENFIHGHTASIALFRDKME